ncbi:hypothetical protein IFT80_18960 [Pseudomonas sp. CFBP 8771]|uniref:hypothetical protein n=1 Tax=Pseudomonas sp. CFBP 8771 TaxID=2775285 RepID=UPI00177B8E67|nr:hypothetical protein [Pseudomonas sp. CFBP 8771]MBD8604722.1 hypothetical protein [Pseudomonas sp. CFBP 8771]
MSDLDESSFPKARSLLLAYSGVVLALWFFGAKLEQFQLMGTAIQLNERVDQAWLILALLNLYLLVRYCQRLERFALHFDEPMNDLYDIRLKRTAIALRQFAMKKDMRRRFTAKPDGPTAHKFAWGKAWLTCYSKIEAENERHPEGVDIRFVSRSYRTEMKLSYEYRLVGGNEENYSNKIRQFETYIPSFFTNLLIKALVIVKGAFVTPWFTDFVAPLIFGAGSTLAAVYMYFKLNHYLWL